MREAYERYLRIAAEISRRITRDFLISLIPTETMSIFSLISHIYKRDPVLDNKKFRGKPILGRGKSTADSAGIPADALPNEGIYFPPPRKIDIPLNSSRFNTDIYIAVATLRDEDRIFCRCKPGSQEISVEIETEDRVVKIFCMTCGASKEFQIPSDGGAECFTIHAADLDLRE